MPDCSAEFRWFESYFGGNGWMPSHFPCPKVNGTWRQNWRSQGGKGRGLPPYLIMSMAHNQGW